MGHSWGTATVITEATASAEGSMKYKCYIEKLCFSWSKLFVLTEHSEYVLRG